MTKQQALNQLRLMQAWHEDFGNGPCPDYDAICYAIGVIEEAPEGLDNLIKALEIEHKKLREMQKEMQEEQKHDSASCIYCHEDSDGYVKPIYRCTDHHRGRRERDMTPLQTLDLILCMAFAYFYVIVGLATVVWIIEHILDFFSKEDGSGQLDCIYFRHVRRRDRLLVRGRTRHIRRAVGILRRIRRWI